MTFIQNGNQIWITFLKFRKTGSFHIWPIWFLHLFDNVTVKGLQLSHTWFYTKKKEEVPRNVDMVVDIGNSGHLPCWWKMRSLLPIFRMCFCSCLIFQTF